MAKTSIIQMSNKQLLKAYEEGKKFVSKKFQVSGTQKTEDGSVYNHDLFIRGLKKLEKIEDILVERKLI